MGVDGASPSMGMDAETGRYITGWDHVVQSLNDIFLTRFGARVMREWYGSFVPDALGRNITRAELVPVLASITSAIEQWEPRFAVERMHIPEASREGRMELIIEGRYRPRALTGDHSDEVTRRVAIIARGDRVFAQQVTP